MAAPPPKACLWPKRTCSGHNYLSSSSSAHFGLRYRRKLTMKGLKLTVLVSLVVSQEFEPRDFKITEALISHGVDVSALPRLSDLSSRSSGLGCDIAVRIAFW